VERFPGDRRPTQDRLPAPPRTDTNPTGVQQEEQLPISEVIPRIALPEGAIRTPTSGYLFFPYRGKLKALKSVELVVAVREAPPVILRLQ
jgi:hypothetical protein